MYAQWENFKVAAKLGTPSQVPVAPIVDSPWLPGWAGINTLDYFLYPEKWLEINKSLLTRFPDAVWIPGFWVEFGMAAEPSAFGSKIYFYQDRPPAIDALSGDIDFWLNQKPINPLTDGFMPLVLRLYKQMDSRLSAEGIPIRMVAARGPMTVTSWLMGAVPLMMAVKKQPEKLYKLLGFVTDTLISWLHAQLDCLTQPEGVLVLDDLIGMISPTHYKTLVEPHLQRIFSEFEGLIRIYHNDTPCPHLFDDFNNAGFDVFNFSHETDIALAKEKMGKRIALMGNVAPLGLGVRGTPEEVYAAATECLDKAAPGGGMILSFGGGTSPETKPENMDALIQAAKDWKPKQG